MSQCSCENCDLEVFENSDKCILHCEKEDITNKDLVEKFWSALKEDILSSQSKHEHIFDSVIFPEHEPDIEYWSTEDASGQTIDNIIEQGTNFNAYDYEKRTLYQLFSSKDVMFKGCKFLADLNLSRYVSTKRIIFSNCEFFSNDIELPSLEKNQLEFKLINFNKKIDFNFHRKQKVNQLIFWNVKFFSDVNFMNLEINYLSFEYVHFETLINMFECEIKEHKFSDSILEEGIFTHTTFGNQVLNFSSNDSIQVKRGIQIMSSFNLPVIHYDSHNCCYIDIQNSKNIKIWNRTQNTLGSLDIGNSSLDFIDISSKSVVNRLKFKNVNILGIFDISNSELGDCIIDNLVCDSLCNFSNTTIKDKLELNSLLSKTFINFLGLQVNSLNRETARNIKNSFEQQNNIIEANKFYALEMKEREKELDKDVKKGKNIFEWLVFKIHGLASNHSQDWTLALFWIINLTFFYSFLEISIQNYFELSSIMKIIFACIAISVIACMTIKIPQNYERRWLTTIPITIVCYIFYGYLVEKDWNLSKFSKNLNPFSIMTGKEYLTFGGLIYKIIIAYLIYQLIISIRQNTRRK